MLFGLITDVHANSLALKACLAQLKTLGVERVAFLGDHVGYGADPQEAVDIIRREAEAGAIVIKGNHDEAVASGGRNMNDTARAAIDWTRGKLDSEAVGWLGSLPLIAREGDVLFVHAEASTPAEWNYVTTPEAAHRSMQAAAAAVTFSGHVHKPALFCDAPGGKAIGHKPVTGAALPLGAHRRWHGLIGSAGQPRDGNPAAAFATYDTATRTLTFRRAAYDSDQAASRVLRAGLPPHLAERLVLGL